MPNDQQDWREQFKSHVMEGRNIFDRAQAEHREMTGPEQAAVQKCLDAAYACRTRGEKATTDRAVMQQIDELGASFGLYGSNRKATLPKVAASGGHGGWSAAVVKANSDHLGHFKALLPSGAIPVTVPLTPEPVRTGEPVLALRQLLPNIADTTGRWSYMRQTVRSSNAATVAAGTRKPTSIFSLSRIEERCRVIAHLSEALPRQDFDDAPLLQRFIDDELRLGLEVALENEILNGDGTGERFTGLANTSGIQVQAFSLNLFETTRKAITKLEMISIAGSGWCFNPLDWERLELLTDNEKSYMLRTNSAALPVDRAARRLWGLPVAISTAVTAGTGYLADFTGSTELRIREDARLDWSENTYDPNKFGTGIGGNNFEANQITWRCEGRFGFAVTRPAGVVKLVLA